MSYDPWPIVWPGEKPQSTQDRIDLSISIARMMLWTRTGRRLGLCTIVEDYTPPTSGLCPVPTFEPGGSWEFARSGASMPIVLLQQPVHSVTSVKIDGVALDAASWRLDGNRLYRLGSSWPAPVEIGGAPRVRVEYRWGVALTADHPLYGLAGAAMGEVAMEVWKALSGEPCKLPSRAVSIARQGVTVTLADPQQFVEQGLLGLTIADQLIVAANPGRRRARARVYSPDMPRATAVNAP